MGPRSCVLGEDGGSLVEMALACLILIPVLFGIIQVSIGLYCYHFAASAAREATRWAMVRGANCPLNFSTAYCSPSSGNALGADANDIAQYVRNLGIHIQNCHHNDSVVRQRRPGPVLWASCSTTQNNSIGNQVKVSVSYPIP